MSLRCFVAVDIENPGVIDAFVRFQGGLLDTGADLKCVERENIHLTMRFLGDVREDLVDDLKGLIEGIRFERFQSEFRGVGAFPNLRRPSVIWVGITRGVEELEGIFNGLEGGLVKLGFRRDGRGFSPHITLARVRSGRNRDRLVEYVSNSADEAFGEFDVKQITLKKSVLTPKGPIYSTLAKSMT